MTRSASTAVESKTGLAQTAAGVVRTYFAYVDIALGKHTLRQALIGVVPASFGPNCDGLLGLDTLRALNANLDAARGLLLIQGEQPEVLFGD